MFCRFGSLLLSRPVAATAWLKRRVHAPGLGVHELRQRVDVGALQLLQRAPLEDQPRQVVRRARAPRAPRPRSTRVFVLPFRLSAGSCSLSNRISDSCLRRVDVERLAGQLEDLRAARAPARGRRAATAPASAARVDADAGPLHRDEHRNQRPLEVAIDRRRAARVTSIGQQPVGELQREVGALAGVVERRVGGHVGERAPPSRRGRRRPPRSAPCSRGARAPRPRADVRSASRRADSSRASCRGRGRASRTPCRASTIASNFRSWPIFSIGCDPRAAASAPPAPRSTRSAGGPPCMPCDGASGT